MNRTVTSLVMKFLMTLIFAVIAFDLVGENPFSWIFIVSLIGTVVNYLVGDLLVLPSMGNLVASTGDGVMAAVVAYLIDLFTVEFSTTLGILVLYGLLVAVGEYFFHQYLMRADEVAPETEE